jgi:acetoin utilization deacetylase AcuC-like enzyme
MRAFYSDQFVLPLPEGHRFPVDKYRLLRERIQQELPEVRLCVAPAATDDELVLVHGLAYVESVCAGTLAPAAQREIGFPWSAAMVERARRSVGATVAAARCVRSGGVSANLAGGTHHAFADRGSGFCVFNDVAVAVRKAQAEWSQTHPDMLRVAVIDLDVHQGNGTAHIFRDDDSVFTLSLHGDRNFPFRKEHSDLDIGLPDACTDPQYLQALDAALLALDSRFSPGLVFYLAGADPLQGDRLGRLCLTMAGLRARDLRVLEWCWRLQLPVVVVMAGGYGIRLEDTVQAHVQTFQLACDFGSRWISASRED